MNRNSLTNTEFQWNPGQRFAYNFDTREFFVTEKATPLGANATKDLNVVKDKVNEFYQTCNLQTMTTKEKMILLKNVERVDQALDSYNLRFNEYKFLKVLNVIIELFTCFKYKLTYDWSDRGALYSHLSSPFREAPASLEGICEMLEFLNTREADQRVFTSYVKKLLTAAIGTVTKEPHLSYIFNMAEKSYDLFEVLSLCKEKDILNLYEELLGQAKDFPNLREALFNRVMSFGTTNNIVMDKQMSESFANILCTEFKIDARKERILNSRAKSLLLLNIYRSIPELLIEQKNKDLAKDLINNLLMNFSQQWTVPEIESFSATVRALEEVIPIDWTAIPLPNRITVLKALSLKPQSGEDTSHLLSLAGVVKEACFAKYNKLDESEKPLFFGLLLQLDVGLSSHDLTKVQIFDLMKHLTKHPSKDPVTTNSLLAKLPADLNVLKRDEINVYLEFIQSFELGDQGLRNKLGDIKIKQLFLHLTNNSEDIYPPLEIEMKEHDEKESKEKKERIDLTIIAVQICYIVRTQGLVKENNDKLTSDILARINVSRLVGKNEGYFKYFMSGIFKKIVEKDTDRYLASAKEEQLEEYYAAREKDLRVNWSHVQVVTDPGAREAEAKEVNGLLFPPQLPADATVKCEEFLTLFKEFNFTNPRLPNYIDPGYLQGKSAAVVEATINKFLYVLKNPVVFTGYRFDPAQPQAIRRHQANWQTHIEAWMKHSILKLKDCPPEIRSAFLIGFIFDLKFTNNIVDGVYDPDEFYALAADFYRQIMEREELPPPIVSNKMVTYEELQTMFAQINFSNNRLPGYVDPNRLTVQGSRVTLGQLQAGLQDFVTKIHNPTWGPRDPQQSKIWKRNLHRWVQHSILILRAREPAQRNEMLQQLAGAGIYCGGKFHDVAQSMYSQLTGKNYVIDKETVEGYISDILATLRFTILDREFQKKAQRESLGQSVHVWPYTVRNAGKAFGVPKKEWKKYDYDEPYMAEVQDQPHPPAICTENGQKDFAKHCQKMCTPTIIIDEISKHFNGTPEHKPSIKHEFRQSALDKWFIENMSEEFVKDFKFDAAPSKAKFLKDQFNNLVAIELQKPRSPFAQVEEVRRIIRGFKRTHSFNDYTDIEIFRSEVRKAEKLFKDVYEREFTEKFQEKAVKQLMGAEYERQLKAFLKAEEIAAYNVAVLSEVYYNDSTIERSCIKRKWLIHLLENFNVLAPPKKWWQIWK